MRFGALGTRKSLRYQPIDPRALASERSVAFQALGTSTAVQPSVDVARAKPFRRPTSLWSCRNSH